MEKEEHTSINNNHSINLIDRKNMLITGVNKVDNFDSEEFIIKTVMGLLTIKGSGLELIKLDTIQGNISIKGKIDSFEYLDNEKNDKSHKIIGRLFK